MASSQSPAGEAQESPQLTSTATADPNSAGQGSRVRGLLSVVLVLVLYFGCNAFIKWVSISKPMALNPYDHSYARAWEHHLWQLALSLVLIALFSRGAWKSWGYTLQNWRSSLNQLWKFCLVYGCIEIICLLWVNLHLPPTARPALGWRIVVPWLCFAWLMPGLSEESMFRGFMQTYLRRSWPGVWRWKQLELPIAGLIAAVIFTAAHVGFNWHPFHITHMNGFQLVTAFVLGLYYSMTYHKTGSLLNPILAHNFADGIVFSTLYILQAFRG